MNESVAEIRACLERYERAMERVADGLRPGDGLLGFGNDPKRSPYHMEFYNQVGEAAARLARGEWPAEEAEETVEFLLTMGEKYGCRLTQPMMEAVQGHVLPLVPLLTSVQAERLSRSYGLRYPRRRRLPVQKKVFQALERRANGR